MTMDAATPAAPKRSFPSSISLGSCIGGIPIKLHLTFFILLVIELISSFRYVNQFPIYILFVVVMWGPILFVTVLVHEFGHALTNKRQGGEVGGIVLWPLGGYTICGPSDSLVGDFKVAFAGPLTHIPMTFFWWMIYLLVKYEFDMQGNETGVWPPYALYMTTMSTSAAGFFQVLAGEAVWLNILLFCFNLLIPAYPLDGGRVFAAGLMLKLNVEPLKAAFVTAWSGLVIASAMVAYAIVSVFTGGMVFGIYFGLVGIWVLFQSYELKCDVKAGDLKNHPIFGRECYQSSSGQTGSSSAAAAAPSNGDDLEMAEDNIPAEEGVMA